MSYHHGQLKQALLKEALDVIEEKGFADLSLRDLARRLKVSHTAPYKHFVNKEALLAALSIEGYEVLIELILKNLKNCQGAQEKLYELGFTYLNFSKSHPAYFSLLYEIDLLERKNYPLLVKAADKSYDLLKNILKEAILEKKYHNIDLQDITFATWSYLHGISSLLQRQRQRHNLPEQSFKDFALKLMQIFEQGLLSKA